MRPRLSRGTIGICFLLLLLAFYFLGAILILTSIPLPSSYRSARHIVRSVAHPKQGEHVSMTRSSKRKMVWCKPLRFLRTKDRPVIALASFPGSGNTWLRYLLQQATGINTGSVYKDYGLLKNGFPGECVSNASVSVVKTHERGQLSFQGFSKAILLVRDPLHAIQAEFNRQGGGHIGYAPLNRYKLRNGRYWTKFVDEQTVKWKEMNLDWRFNYTEPLLIVFYEDLLNDLESTLRELITFIDLPIIEENIKCTLERKEGIYKRKKRVVVADPFRPNMREKLEKAKQEVYQHLYTYIQNSKVKQT